MELMDRIEDYWVNRAESYAKVNQDELAGIQREQWRNVLRSHFPSRKPENIQVLDVGTGPGFFAILLAEAGYQVTAVDYTSEMLRQAKINAGEYSERIRWFQMDAQELKFPEQTFDVVVSRNLTWNLQDPQKAYAQWYRVLKTGGQILNFDANWYQHLYDPKQRKAYEEDRMNVAFQGMEDHYTSTDIDEMEDIARQVPLSKAQRPVWDLHVLKRLGFNDVKAALNIWQQVWSETEKINYGSTPMFLVSGVK